MEDSRALVFTHTHWDLQWYLSRYELLDYLGRQVKYLIDGLERGLIHSFVLDGQVAPLLEFLEHNPEYAERIRRLVSDGKLEVGPWYTQPDTFLVNGESLARNLVLGIILSEKLGRVLRVGYLPDSFGLTPQLPQILVKTGIHVIVFERGLCHDMHKLGADFLWSSPEGSKIIALFLPKGYCGASFLGCIEESKAYSQWSGVVINDTIGYSLEFFNMDEIGVDPEKARLDAREFIKEVKDLYRSGIIPVPIGCDQYIPRRDFYEDIDYVLKGIAEEGVEPVYNGLKILEELNPETLMDKLHHHLGELRCARYRNVLWGVASTRVTIKQLSFKLELLLQALLEPLLVFSDILGAETNHLIVRNTWLRLLRSHFHDAICGTVSDNVARRIEGELEEGVEITKQIIYHLLARLADKIGLAENTLLVYNPLPYNEWNTIHVLLPSGNWRSIIVDGVRRPLEKIVENKILGLSEYVYTYNHRPLSLTTIVLKEHVDEDLAVNVGGGSNSVWNQYVEVIVDKEQGYIIVRDKRTSYEVLLDLVDYGDYGDVYDYNPPERNTLVELSRDSIEGVRVEVGRVKATLTIKGSLRIPEDTNSKARSNKLVENPFTISFTVYDSVPRVDVHVRVKNNALNHVLRLRITKGRETEVYGDQAFIKVKLDPREEKQLGPELEPLNHVVQSWIALRDMRGGVALALNGLHEVFVKDEYVEITLYRSTGWLSREDLRTRKGHAGPPIPTPEAQYLGKTLEFNLALIPFTAEEWVNGRVYSRIESYYRKPIAYFNRIRRGDRVDYYMELLELEPPLMLSALKPVEPERGDNGVVLRVYNLGNHDVVLSIKDLALSKFYEYTYRATLDERIVDEVKDGIKVKPYSIETILFTGKKRGG